MAPGRGLRAALRFFAAVALMAAAILLVGPERLERQLRHVEPGWFALAVALLALAQWVSILRWETIARIFGLRVDRGAMTLAYAQGMTVNVLLPGATLGGDALRSVRLQGLGNPLSVSALTVLLDRLSGLWTLCVLSLVTGAGFALAVGADALANASRAAPDAPASALLGAPLLAAYLLGLGLACALPWLPLRPKPVKESAAGGRAGPGAWALRAWNRLCDLHDLAIAERAPLVRSLWSSVLVQALCALTLWCCARAAGGPAGYWQVQAVAAPVFVAGALPLSYGGFGARELVAMASFPLVGLTADLGLAASVLYGIVAVVLGLVCAPAFAVPAARLRGPGES